LAAPILPAVAVLALLAGRALVALAAKHGREAGDALTIEAAEPRFAITGCLALLAAAVGPPVAVLALLADGTALGLAAEDGRQPRGTTPVVTRQARRTITRGAAALVDVRDAHLRGAVAARRATRHARTAIARRTRRLGIGLTG